MKLAIIGMGIMGCKYAKMISDGLVTGTEIAAVESKIVEVDAVLIVTPHLSHSKIAAKAMKLGLHVLCDKPAGAYSRQAREMREEVEKHEGLIFGMMFNQRMNPMHQKIRESVQSGTYGKMK